ncbi:hypothetical protein GCK72_010073 [Caenorhabditis remanei]|uniref:Uncharacterized protein n=1 Tax=Caenorhabditis remanei TaxID=31234 RepID=A0A6A5H4N4_CAERE|nr:hypothetical protein GCK72_010073 [Caenorhabditis remanei]KAF1761816.1 hypothetical protein GCK72_010073 [Caenorhabditis remanei]
MQGNYMNVPPGQRPLMKRKPAQVQSVVSCSASYENQRVCIPAEVVELQKTIYFQVQAVLLRFLPFYEVAYTEVKKQEFLNKFRAITKNSLEEKITEIQRSNKAWSLPTIIENIHFLDYKCTLETDEKFVFTPVTQQHVPLTTQISYSARNQDETPGIVSLSQNLSNLIASSTTAADANTVIHGTQNRTPVNLISYAARMFKKPMWTWLGDEAREEKRSRVVEFFKSAQDANSDISNVSIRKEAKRLARALWESSIRNFPQVLYLLRLLRARRPNGFELLNFESEIEVEVSILIDYIGFYEISDKEVSIIYNYLYSTAEGKTSKKIHKYLCQFHKGWENRYNEATGMKEIERICDENKMFSLEDGAYKAKGHSYKIVLPMYFMPCLLQLRQQL